MAAALVLTVTASCLVAFVFAADDLSAANVVVASFALSAVVSLAAIGAHAQPVAGVSAGVSMVVIGVACSAFTPAQFDGVTNLAVLLTYGSTTLVVQAIGAAMAGLSVTHLLEPVKLCV